MSLTGDGRKTSHGGGGGGNRVGLQAMRLVETVSQTGLLALLANGANLTACHICHKQLYGVGADINDSAADGFHATRLRVARPEHEHRSEEHTSELQSLRHLVCRLLLE